MAKIWIIAKITKIIMPNYKFRKNWEKREKNQNKDTCNVWTCQTIAKFLKGLWRMGEKSSTTKVHTSFKWSCWSMV